MISCQLNCDHHFLTYKINEARLIQPILKDCTGWIGLGLAQYQWVPKVAKIQTLKN
jgi:hypothetical protein